MIADGAKVKIRYKIFAEDGTLAADNINDHEPQTFFLDRGQLMPELEFQIKNMQVGELKKITLQPAQAFGATNPNFLKQTRLSKIPEKQRQVGTVLDLEDAEGNLCRARIHEINDNIVTLDFNHPLAGQQVTFEVELLSVND